MRLMLSYSIDKPAILAYWTQAAANHQFFFFFFFLQILEEICQKSGWGQPIYTLHSTAGTNPDEEPLYLYKVMVPGLSMTYIPDKVTRSIDEAKTIAAEYSLVQLGYTMEGTCILMQREREGGVAKGGGKGEKEVGEERWRKYT